MDTPVNVGPPTTATRSTPGRSRKQQFPPVCPQGKISPIASPSVAPYRMVRIPAMENGNLPEFIGEPKLRLPKHIDVRYIKNHNIVLIYFRIYGQILARFYLRSKIFCKILIFHQSTFFTMIGRNLDDFRLAERTLDGENVRQIFLMNFGLIEDFNSISNFVRMFNNVVQSYYRKKYGPKYGAFDTHQCIPLNAPFMEYLKTGEPKKIDFLIKNFTQNTGIICANVLAIKVHPII